MQGLRWGSVIENERGGGGEVLFNGFRAIKRSPTLLMRITSTHQLIILNKASSPATTPFDSCMHNWFYESTKFIPKLLLLL